MNTPSVSHRRWGVWLTLAVLTAAMSPHVCQVAKADNTPSSIAPFAGKFAGDNLTLELSESAGGYVGTITQGDNKFPAKAVAAGQTLAGTFVVADHEFTFAATFADGRLMLVSGGKTHSLAKVGADPAQGPAGPAAVARNSSPPPAAPAAGNANLDGLQSFGGFSVLGATAKGKTLFIQLPNAKSFESAITQTADELAKIFDARPVLSGAFADAKAKSKGGATLAAKLKGQDLQGVIFCSATPTGGSATVIIAAPGISKEDVATLLAGLPAPLKMQTHSFPDGSGTIDLPEGWTTIDDTAAHGIGVTGPAGQRVVWHNVQVLYDPNCSMVRMGQQTYQTQLQNYQYTLNQRQQLIAMHQRNPSIPMPGDPPKPPVQPDADPNIAYPNVNFCRYCDGPADLLKYWYPISEEKQKRRGKGFSSLEKVFAVFPGDPNPMVPGSTTGAAYVAVTDNIGDTVSHMRVLIHVTTSPLIKGEAWQLCASTMRAPDASFDRDLPVMTAIMNSVTVDMNVVNRVIAGDGSKIRKFYADKFQVMVEAGQEFQDRQAGNFAAHEEQIAAQEKARHDSASDFIEYIGGVRHVYDTQTGQSLNVNLFNSNGIVNGLNDAANDPNRFVQIPLRYER